jgi:hypothetical protein
VNASTPAAAKKATAPTIRKPITNQSTGVKTMTKTNTNTTSAAEKPKATTNTATPAELSRLALADAKARAADCQKLSEQAEANAAAILSRVASCDLTVTLDEWRTAHDGPVLAAALVSAAGGKVKRAEYSLINDDFRLAETIADVLRGLYGRFVEIKIVGEDRLVTKPEDARESVLYVVQKKATLDTGGIWSGNLRLTYFRSAVMAQLDGREIERECRSRDWGVTVSGEMGSELSDGQHQDTAQVEIRGVYPPVPVLASVPTDGTFRELARSVSNRLYQSVRSEAPQDVFRYADDPITRHAFADVNGVQVIGTDEADGRHRMTVEMSFGVKPDGNLRGNVDDLLSRAAEECVGLAEHGTGNITAVESFDLRPVNREVNGKPAYIEGAARFVVTARFTVSYRIA